MNDMDIFYCPCMRCRHLLFDDIRFMLWCCAYRCNVDDVQCCELFYYEEDEP